jgi:hypothetical protein
MDKEGNYRVVHGLSLSEIPEASDIKLVFNGHGDDKAFSFSPIKVFFEKSNYPL